MGAWIEIKCTLTLWSIEEVAPLVGAWIEIDNLAIIRHFIVSLPLWERGLKFVVYVRGYVEYKSLPLWERGLKYIGSDTDSPYSRRSPCGSVD